MKQKKAGITACYIWFLRISKGGFEPPTFVKNDALTTELHDKTP